MDIVANEWLTLGNFLISCCRVQIRLWESDENAQVYISWKPPLLQRKILPEALGSFLNLWWKPVQ